MASEAREAPRHDPTQQELHDLPGGRGHLRVPGGMGDLLCQVDEPAHDSLNLLTVVGTKIGNGDSNGVTVTTDRPWGG